MSANKLKQKKHKFVGRIDFSYSRSEANKIGCPFCVNTIYGAQFDDSKRRHLISINGSTLVVLEDGIERKNMEHRSVIACPVKLRRWEQENVEQF